LIEAILVRKPKPKRGMKQRNSKVSHGNN